MPQHIRAPDGTIVEFPDGMSDAQISAAMRKEYAPKISPKNPYAATAAAAMHIPAAVEPLRQFNRQATFGLSEAFPAAVFAGAQALKGGDFGQAYSAARDAETQLTQSRASPLNTAAGVVGGLIAPVPGGAVVRSGGGLIGRAARAAAVGGGAGLVSGAANAQRVEDIPKDAVAGGVLGGLIGGVVPVGGAVAGRVFAGANRAAGGKLINPAAAASRRLAVALQRDGASPQQITQAVDAWSATGARAPALLDVAGENTRALLRSAASKPGPGRNAAVEYAATTRESTQGAALDRARALTPDTTVSAAEHKATLTADRQAKAGEEYSRAYPQLIDAAPVADALSGDAGKRAIALAHRESDAMQLTDQVRELAALKKAEPVAPDAKVMVGGVEMNAGDLPENVRAAIGTPLPPQVSLGTLDRLKVALNRLGDDALENGRAGEAGGFHTRAALIDGHLAHASEHYAGARNNYAARSEAIDAVDLGGSILNASPADFAKSLEGLSPEAVEAAKVGARQALTDAIGLPANASPTLRKAGFADTARSNLRALFGPEEGDRYAESAQKELEKAANANFISPNTGSQTEMRGTDTLDLQPDKIAAFVRRPFSSTASFLLNGTNTLTPAEREGLVRLGTGDPLAPGLVPPPDNLGSGFLTGRLVTVAPGQAAGLFPDYFN